MNYKIALEMMISGHPVVKNNKIYFIPHGLSPIEKNIHYVLIDDGYHPSDIIEKEKLEDDWKTL